MYKCIITFITLFIPSGYVAATKASRDSTLGLVDKKLTEGRVGSVQVPGSRKREGVCPRLNQFSELIPVGLSEVPPLYRSGRDRFNRVIRGNQWWSML